ncbi:hypothetical protein [Streptomyces sp. CB03911]|uniref:hypothetical protein n=1 Tax=Streptomycetaceae TaxID=2062 RepID=UPI000940645B|nr:hypothetical protein [Streptomyces sp. CB03911]OKI27646.1 hypothetical protein A6A07_27375 [Streptomyces sp. CB03911]
MAHVKRHRRAGGSAHGGVRRGRQAVFLAAGLLVLISLYSVTIGSNGWLWFGWAVLLMVCAALFAVRD